MFNEDIYYFGVASIIYTAKFAFVGFFRYGRFHPRTVNLPSPTDCNLMTLIIVMSMMSNGNLFLNISSKREIYQG